MINLKSTFSVLALSSALLTVPMVSQANEVSSDTEKSTHSHQHKKSEARKQHHVWSQLDLSEQQQSKMAELKNAQSPAIREKYKEVKAARAELRALSTADHFDEAKAKAASNKLAQAQADVAFNRAKFQFDAYAVLTPEQRTKLKELKSKRKANKHEHN